MADRRSEFGRRGEDAACAYLLRHGYSIVERNYRCRRGEIDIIAAKDGGAVFVEVETRRSLKFGTPGMAELMPSSRKYAPRRCTICSSAAEGTIK